MNVARDETLLGSTDPRLAVLEHRESQLWWLAVMVMVALTCGVCVIDWTTATQGLSDSPLAVALNTRFMRLALMVGIFLVSAYFRDTSKKLRRANGLLVSGLRERSDELGRKNTELCKMKELSEALINETDLRNALGLAMDTAADIINADSASIMLRDRDSDVMHIVVSRGLPDEVVRNTRVRIGEALAGRVAECGEAVIINSDELEGDLRSQTRRLSEIVSAIIVPIHVGTEVLGVINMSKRRGGTCFSEDDLAVVSTLVNQVTMVLIRIELWQDLQKQVARLDHALSDLKRTQSELVQSEKLASIGQLAAGVAHEINNPLQVIMGRAELLLMETDPQSDTARHLTTVIEHVERISSIVSALLRFSRRQPDDLQDSVVVDEALVDVTRLLGKQLSVDNVSLELDLNCEGLEIPGSRVKLQQVFMNLILNAYAAMREVGGQLRIHSEARSDSMVLTFADTGTGIPEANLPLIFDPFFTTKGEGEGTGLGLFVTYEIIEAHRGHISVASRDGEGTTFTIVLPLSEAVAKAA